MNSVTAHMSGVLRNAKIRNGHSKPQSSFEMLRKAIVCSGLGRTTSAVAVVSPIMAGSFSGPEEPVYVAPDW